MDRIRFKCILRTLDDRPVPVNKIADMEAVTGVVVCYFGSSVPSRFDEFELMKSGTLLQGPVGPADRPDPTSNAEEAEVERFYEDLQDLSELTPKKDVLFIIGDWNAKVGSQETPGVTGKFGLAVQNEAGQRLIEFCQENALVIANTLFQQHKKRLYIWTSPDGHY